MEQKKPNDAIDTENQKALKLALRSLAVCLGLGFLFGILMAVLDLSGAKDNLAELLTVLFTEWNGALILIASLAAFLFAILPYRKAKNLLKLWDGEDEVLDQEIDDLLSHSLLASNVGLLLGLLLYGVSLSLLEEVSLPQGAFATVMILLTFVWHVLVQQKVVDLVRRMNPEKRGSVYDAQFQQKWYDSCDEAERQQIGEASRFAFNMVCGIVCPALWVAAMLISVLFHTGPLAEIFVGVLWLALTLCYQLKAIQLGRARRAVRGEEPNETE